MSRYNIVGIIKQITWYLSLYRAIITVISIIRSIHKIELNLYINTIISIILRRTLDLQIQKQNNFIEILEDHSNFHVYWEYSN